MDRTRQAGLLFVVALALWAVWPVASLWALLAAYLAAWLLLNVAAAARRHWPSLELSRTQAVTLALVLLAAPLVLAARAVPQLLDEERLANVHVQLLDRLRLEADYAIAPPVLFTDHPQTFYVNAPGARELAVRLSASGPEVAARDLGHGLFRVDYDPGRDAAPATRSGPLEVDVLVDGGSTRRSLLAVTTQAHPRWFASAPEQGVAATVSEETDEAFLVHRDGRIRQVAVGDGPTDCAFFADGTRLAVTHRYDPWLLVLDVESGTVLDRVPIGRFQVRAATSPDQRRLAVASDGERPGVWLLPLVEDVPTDFVELDFRPDWLAFGADAETLVVSSLHEPGLHKLVRGDAGWRVVADLALVRPAVTLARSHDGAHIYLAVTDYSPTGRPHVGSHFVQDQLLTLDTDLWRITERQRTGRRGVGSLDLPGGVSSGASPMGIAALEDGSLLIAFAGSNEVWRLLGARADRPLVLDSDTSPLTAPHGVAHLGGGVWAASSPSSGTIVVVTARAAKGVAALAESDEVLGRSDPLALLVRRGERVFYEATRSGISCQSCHAHGGTDHSEHNIGQSTMLHTLTTRGLAGTAPYLSDASSPRIDHLLRVSESVYRGFFRAEPDRGPSLEAYVAALPAPINPRLLAAAEPERERAGLDAFVKADCTRCHSFPAFTNLGQVPIRSIFPSYGERFAAWKVLDVPSLRGLFGSAPYLHDGRAKTLEDVIGEENEGNRHGNVDALSESERDDLVYFLESL